jgi:glycosyltransferase involved in cell wall biosynthesis
MRLAIILPVYNEEAILKKNVDVLRAYLRSIKQPATIIISDNNSTDGTSRIGRVLAKHAGIQYLHVAQKGRGIAIKRAAMSVQADWYCYLDIDLPLDLRYLQALIGMMASGQYDFVSGTRHHKGGRLVAPLRRRIVSKGYLYLTKIMLGNFKIQDIQLGFKGWNRKVRDSIFPLCKDHGWFFDTELTYYAFKKRCEVGYLPVTYTISDEERKSNVKLISDAWKMLKNLIRLRVHGDV